MLHHIKKLQKHPEHVRERVALGTALAVTLLIFAAWGANFSSRFALDDAPFESQAAAAGTRGLIVANEKKPDSPISILKEKAGEAYGGFKEAVGY